MRRIKMKLIVKEVPEHISNQDVRRMVRNILDNASSYPFSLGHPYTRGDSRDPHGGIESEAGKPVIERGHLHRSRLRAYCFADNCPGHTVAGEICRQFLPNPAELKVSADAVAVGSSDPEMNKALQADAQKLEALAGDDPIVGHTDLNNPDAWVHLCPASGCGNQWTAKRPPKTNELITCHVCGYAWRPRDLMIEDPPVPTTEALKAARELICPVCGFNCLGKGGSACIDKQGIVGLIEKRLP